MTIEQLGSIGEIVGALATVATLAYLAIQIRQSSLVALAQAEREVDNSGATLAVSQDAELARIYREGCRDFTAMSENDQIRFSFLMSNLFSNYQTHLSSYDKGLLPAERRGTTLATVRFMIEQPGVCSWWEQNCFHFGAAFRTEVERLREESGSKTRSAAQQSAAADSAQA